MVKTIQLGETEASIANHYEEETFAKYGKDLPKLQG